MNIRSFSLFSPLAYLLPPLSALGGRPPARFCSMPRFINSEFKVQTMSSFFTIGDHLATFLLHLLPSRISSRIRQNISPQTIHILQTGKIKTHEPRMTLFEGVFATLLFDMALFGTNNLFINGIISLFTTIQNSWDTVFANTDTAKANVSDFCTRLDIQQDPWIWSKKKEEYISLNDFFSRTYALEYFPAVGSGRVVSPACCKMTSYHDDADMKSILIKGCDYEIDRIGLPEGDLKRYASNRVVIGYLSPKDYHRVHAPISVSF